MPNYTPNYNLVKPLQTEFGDIDVLNGNSDILDSQLKAISDEIGELNDLDTQEKINLVSSINELFLTKGTFAKDLENAVANLNDVSDGVFPYRDTTTNRPSIGDGFGTTLTVTGRNSNFRIQFAFADNTDALVGFAVRKKRLNWEPWSVINLDAFPKTGGTLTGDVTINKNIPKISFSSPSGVQTGEIRLNVSDTADFGFQMLKNNQIFFDARGERDVRFKDSNGNDFSIQSLKRDCSDAFDEFASAITAKGSAVPQGANRTQILNGINAIQTGGVVNGTVVSSNAQLPFNLLDGQATNINFFYVQVSLNFTPRMIHIVNNGGTNSLGNSGIYNILAPPPDLPSAYIMSSNNYSTNSTNVYTIRTNVGNAYVNATGFRLPVLKSGSTYSYIAVR